MSGAVVPVDIETTAALVAEIKRLINVVGGLVLKQGPDYECGFVDGMSKQAQSSVDKAVNAMAQPAQEPVAWIEHHKAGDNLVWEKPNKGTALYTTPPQRPLVGLTDEEIEKGRAQAMRWAEAALKEKNT